jgi:DNA-binding protein YbaB
VRDVGRDIDETWIEEAIARYRRAELLLEEFERTVAGVEVTVRSPDGLVEIAVAADGTVRDVTIAEAAQGRPVRELSRSVKTAVLAAADAARWAREKLHHEMFGEYRPLAADPGRPR